MDRPRRFQLSRRKGFRLPENTVVVARPGKYGNMFSIVPNIPAGQRIGPRYIAVPTAEDAVECFREVFDQEGETADGLRSLLPDLRGKNVACWCALDAPCHGDVWLELANK